MITLLPLSVVTLITLIVYRKYAPSLGLLDKPNERKLHTGNIPLVGGVSICTALVLYLALFHLIPHTGIYTLCIIIITVIGALDDKHDLSFKVRLFVQALLSLVMMFAADMSLSNLGNMFGFGEVNLFLFGYILTIFAVVGAINAFNMVDGIDGLVGGLSIVTFALMGFMFSIKGFAQIALFCFALVACIVPYLLFNLGFFKEKRKVFMGDAGSMMLGFTVVWVLLLGTQQAETKAFNPVTALWLIALPLMDMAATMIRRMLSGDSPFHPDRKHYHHVLQDYGYSKKITLCIMTAQAAGLGLVGVVADIQQLSEPVMFYGFLFAFAIHFGVVLKLQKDKPAIARVY